MCDRIVTDLRKELSADAKARDARGWNTNMYFKNEGLLLSTLEDFEGIRFEWAPNLLSYH